MKKLLMLFSVGLLALSSIVLAQNYVPKEVAADVVKVKNIAVHQTTDTSNQAEVFMEIANHGKWRHNLIAAVSPLYKETQLHKTLTKNQQQAMQQVASFQIIPKHEKNLHQGGLHIMLINAKAKLAVGEIIPLTLVFSDGSYLLLHVPVKAPLA